MLLTLSVTVNGVFQNVKLFTQMLRLEYVVYIIKEA